ncbi:MAG: putative Coenzyme synthesis protein [Nitrospira sp.]|jgi:coenzyme PQQ biosynthesis protein PqqD|nr:putative Coenzyme synthesis protein [Nitrospira sp.]
MIRCMDRPRLSRKVRLRFDRRTGRSLLLYPETGLELNGSAAEIAGLCTGVHTVDDIARLVAPAYEGVSPEEIKPEVLGFLDALAARGLLQGLR